MTLTKKALWVAEVVSNKAVWLVSRMVSILGVTMNDTGYIMNDTTATMNDATIISTGGSPAVWIPE